LAGTDVLPFTQEFLAEMIGVTRPSVSVIAHTLQQAGFIRYSRGANTGLAFGRSEGDRLRVL
jgi:DNA-binding IscR family transcriptional regulator